MWEAEDFEGLEAMVKADPTVAGLRIILCMVA